MITRTMRVMFFATEFVWPSKAKPFTCNDLKPIHKNRDEEMKFTFNIAKCDRDRKSVV